MPILPNLQAYSARGVHVFVQVLKHLASQNANGLHAASASGNLLVISTLKWNLWMFCLVVGTQVDFWESLFFLEFSLERCRLRRMTNVALCDNFSFQSGISFTG